MTIGLKSLSNIPVLESERLRLRAHGLIDIAKSLAMWSDPETVRFLGLTPSTQDQAQERVVNYLAHWLLTGFGYWVVEEKHTGQFIGEVGFADFRREIKPSILGFPEMGWVLSPGTYGKGYATEAATVALQWGDAHLHANRTVCLIASNHDTSIRVATKLGFQPYATTTFRDQPTLMLDRPKGFGALTQTDTKGPTPAPPRP